MSEYVEISAGFGRAIDINSKYTKIYKNVAWNLFDPTFENLVAMCTNKPEKMQIR